MLLYSVLDSPYTMLVIGLAGIGALFLLLRAMRQSSAHARASEHSRLTAALETATDGVWDYDFSTHRGRRSGAQLRHLGYDADGVNADPGAWSALLHPDDAERVLDELHKRSRQAHDDSEMTYRVRASNGSYHTIVDRGRVVERTADGLPRLLIGISADVTERLRVDAARDHSERRFRAVFNSALQGQVLVDSTGICVEVNATALAISGADRDEVVGFQLAECPWFTGLPLAQQIIRDRLADAVQDHAVRFQVEAHVIDGRLGLVECSMTAVSGDDGRVQQVLCELRDVTERRRTEEAMREIGALTTMGRLAARVAHEINNPLAGIQNSFLLLADAVPADHPHRRFVHSIEREILRIASVTRQLYETYRPDQELSTESSLTLVVHDAVNFLDQVNRSRGIRIVTDLALAPPMVPVPDALLRQTLYNLLQNAVEASPLDGTVTLRAYRDGDECVILVMDEGAGVGAQHRARIFEPFVSSRTTKYRSTGMGIGLALVRQSVEALGGKVQIVGSEESGATFEVRFPMTSVVANVSR